MKISPLQLVGRILLIVAFVWMFVDSTRIALNHEDSKAMTIAKQSKAMADEAPEVN